MELQPVSPEAIVAEARSFLGVRYVHQGRSRKGVDCVGLLFCVFSKFREVVIDPNVQGPAAEYFRHYTPNPNPLIMGELLDHFFDTIPKEEAREGDVVWMKRLREPQHVGIVAYKSGRTIIHAVNHPGTVIEQPIDERHWDKKVVCALRLKEV